MLKKIIHYYSEGVPNRTDFPAGFTGLYQYIKKILSDIPPGISRLLKLQPILAFISGIIVIFLIRRGFEHVPIVIICVVLTFVYLAFRFYIQKNNSDIFQKIADVALMVSVNYMLLFILPFYFESMTFPSRNMIFGLIIITLAVISNWYYLFERLILKSVLTSAVYYALIFFCVLNFIFPIIFGLRNIWSLAVSGGFAGVTAILCIYPHIRVNKNWRELLKFLSGILISFAFLWFGRSLIPPAPLELIYATACEGIEEHSPLFPFESNNNEAIKEAYFYSAIFAPKGLSERINHVWYFNGERLLSIPLNEIRGGREEGYRTWSKHVLLEGPGKYTVEIWTAGGQFLGSGSFIITVQ